MFGSADLVEICDAIEIAEAALATLARVVPGAAAATPSATVTGDRAFGTMAGSTGILGELIWPDGAAFVEAEAASIPACNCLSNGMASPPEGKVCKVCGRWRGVGTGATARASEITPSGSATLLWLGELKIGESKEMAGTKRIWSAVASGEDDVERRMDFGFDPEGTCERAPFNANEERTVFLAGVDPTEAEVWSCWPVVLLGELPAPFAAGG